MLAIAWGLLGLSGMLDLGIGRATTKLTSDAIGRSDFDSIPVVLKTAIQLSLFMSLGGALLLGVVLSLGANLFLKTQAIASSELNLAAIALSLALPFQAMSSTYKGVNEAFLNLRAISFIRMGLGASTFAVPLLIASFTNRVDCLVASILISRVMAFGFYRMCSWSCVREVTSVPGHYSSSVKSKLLVFGGWFTVSCVVNPIVSSMDRILLGSLVSATAVATYALPYEICTQSLIAVGAVTTIAFPHLSKSLAVSFVLAWKKFHHILGLCLLMMLIIAGGLYCLGAIILSTWLGSEVTHDTVRTMQILALGLVPYTLGTISISFLHACARTDITAKVHLAELIVFVPLTYYLIRDESAIGAAKAWGLRATIDAIVLYIATFVVSTNLRQSLLSKTSLGTRDAII